MGYSTGSGVEIHDEGPDEGPDERLTTKFREDRGVAMRFGRGA
jgi:hypothetical protein